MLAASWMVAASAMISATRSACGSACPRRGGWAGLRRSQGCGTAATQSMPPGPPMGATPGARVAVLRFDQAQPDQAPVLIHSLDRVAVQLQLADHSRGGVKPSRAQRGKRHRLLPSTTQLLKRQTMLSLNERHRTELSTLRPRRSRLLTLRPLLRQRRLARQEVVRGQRCADLDDAVLRFVSPEATSRRPALDDVGALGRYPAVGACVV